MAVLPVHVRCEGGLFAVSSTVVNCPCSGYDYDSPMKTLFKALLILPHVLLLPLVEV
jgi:hypothetical protein